MSLVKSISTEIAGKTVQVNLPDRKTLVLRGTNKLQILHIAECLLAQDMTGYYWELDKQYGFNYKEVEGLSSMVFNNGAILGRDKAIQIQGTVPNIHTIRYLGASNQFRSFFLQQEINSYSQVYTDMRHYSHIIDDAHWIRLVSVVNNLIGEEVVKLVDEELTFKFLEDYTIPVEGQQIIYLLLAECFLTPDDYSRVLLLPNIPYLEKSLQVRFLEILDDVNNHTLTLSLADIEPTDLKSSSSISFLNV